MIACHLQLPWIQSCTCRARVTVLVFPVGRLRLSFPGGDEILIPQCQFCLQLSDVCFCLPFTGL